MSAPIPTTEPTAFTAGETLIWRRSCSGYSAADGWALTNFFRGKGGFDQAAVADGSGFKVTVPSATTAGLTSGTYYWQAWVEKAGEKHLVDSGEAAVTAAFAPAGNDYDGRSEVKKTLDAIDAMIAGKASLDQQEYMIGNRSLKRIPIPDLIALRTKYAQLYAREQQRARLEAGAPFFRTVLTRFTGAS